MFYAFICIGGTRRGYANSPSVYTYVGHTDKVPFHTVDSEYHTGLCVTFQKSIHGRNMKRICLKHMCTQRNFFTRQIFS